MEWIDDPSRGDWLRERLDAGFGTMHGVVPRGYEAYARVLHPATVWSGDDGAPLTWAQTAEAFGTALHPLAQWQRLVRTPVDGDWRTGHLPDGREFTSPEEGSMPPELLAAVARRLIARTSTPDAGCAALWEGWGGLLGFMGQTPSRRFFSFGDAPVHEELLERSIHNPFEDTYRKATWQHGILSERISSGPRLQLPGRDHVLFSAAPRAFAEPDWILDTPWRDAEAEEHGFPPSAQHPSLLWPEDRAWVLVSEIDFDSTVIAGPAALVREICEDPAIEALPIPEGADLSAEGDEVNR